MGRRRNRLILPKKVARIMDIIELLLDCHPAGYLVLCGRADWPDAEEVADMLDKRAAYEPVHVQGGSPVPFAQKHVERIEAARRYMSLLDKYGGHEAMTAAVGAYQRYDPQTSALLRKIGMAGMPGAKSLEELAAESHMDTKTLYSVKNEAIKDIAYFVVFGGDTFELMG
ncbi:MAG: hypothetical protein K6E42_08970 [Synergistes sp.]|nr:hypothetical protein [Synergistes sp.]